MEPDKVFCLRAASITLLPNKRRQKILPPKRPRIRREDLFARYGGEEFVCVLASTNLEGGVVFAEHIRGLIADRACVFDNEAFTVTISVGVSTVWNEPGVDLLTLIKRADDNLYAAKRNGRNQVVPSVESVTGSGQ